jgi:ubiquinone/menaquinone biosynthesis C-methylase UbiE
LNLRRVTCHELLDDDLGTPQEVAANLDDLWRINRWLGGVSSNLSLLGRFLDRTGLQRIRLLEVGAGDARLAGALRDELARRGVEADFFVLDRRSSHLAHGSPLASGLRAVAADALALPFRENSFDLVTCNLVFHHFSGGEAQAFMQQLVSVASRAVLINDLERHVVPYLFTIGTPWLMRSRLSRHDAPASVRQAYTREELVALARAAGFADFEVRRLPPFRLGLTLWKTPVEQALKD